MGGGHVANIVTDFYCSVFFSYQLFHHINTKDMGRSRGCVLVGTIYQEALTAPGHATHINCISLMYQVYFSDVSSEFL